MEAGIAHGLKKRAAGLLPAQDTQSVLLKLAKLSKPAADLVKKLSGDAVASKDFPGNREKKNDIVIMRGFQVID